MSSSDQALTHQAMPSDASALEKVLLQGDLSSLKPPERIQYYRELCVSLDLNPLTKPFEYLEMKGQGGRNILTLYAKKDCTDQLRNKRSASSKIVARETVEGVYIVTARASTPEGREEESIGAVPIIKEGGKWRTNEEGRKEFVGDGTFIPLRPEERANAMMKAETKAKRRATLSLFGLGFISEEEAEGIPGARKVAIEEAHKLLPAAQSGDKRDDGRKADATVPPTPDSNGAPRRDDIDPRLKAQIDRAMKSREEADSVMGEICESIRELTGDAWTDSQWAEALKKHGDPAKKPSSTEPVIRFLWTSLEAAKLPGVR